MTNSPDNELQLARQALDRQARPEAIRHLRAALERNPASVEAWVLLAQAVDNPDQARRALERALRLQPDHETANRMLKSLAGRVDAPAATALAGDSPAAGSPGPVSKRIAGQELGAAGPPRTPPASAPPARRDFPVELLLGVVALCLLCLVGGLLAANGLERLLGSVSVSQVEPTPEDVTSVIYANMLASNTEDLAGYMATIHPSSPAYSATETGIQQAFTDYDLSYQLLELTVLDQSSFEASVAFTLRTEKISGPAFSDNVVTGRWILRKDGGIWKIYNQEIDNVEYLN